jgi:4-amino-4-deoxy-L-arabinose transferase-like glycosyltransferase
MGSEFPIMNYIVFLLYKLFGVHWWQGRLINLLMSSIGSFYFYKIIFKYIDKKVAFNATIILIVSIWFAHSRKFMPDVFSTSLVIIGIYYGISYLKEKNNVLHLFLYSFFVSLGLLSKLPSFVMVAFLTPFVFDKSISLKPKIKFVLMSVLVIIPSIWWYFYWAPYLTQHYGFYYFFMGNSLSNGLNHLLIEWHNMLKRFYTDAFFYIAFIFYIIGLVRLIYIRNFKLILIFSSAFILQISLMLKGGETFVHHTYYIIPFVPIMALFSAYGLEIIKVYKYKQLVLMAIVVECVLNQQHDFRKKPKQEYKLNLTNLTHKFSSSNDLIAINGDSDPTLLYFSDRKGWTWNSRNFTDSLLIKSIYNKGCQLIIWDKHRSEPPIKIKNYYIIFKNVDFVIWSKKKHQ